MTTHVPPSKAQVVLDTQRELLDRKNIECLLEVLARFPRMQPTHFGLDERARITFDRDKMIAAILADEILLGARGLARRKAPRYEGWFDSSLVSRSRTAFHHPDGPRTRGCGLEGTTP